MGFLGMADSALIIEALDVPDGGDHQCFFLIENCLVQGFYCAAVRRAGVIGTILTAEVLLTKFPELGVYRHIRCRDHSGIKALLPCQFQQFLIHY